MRDIPGVRVIRDKGFIGVVADREWEAVQAAERLEVTWSEPAPSFPEMAASASSQIVASCRSTGRSGAPLRLQPRLATATGLPEGGPRPPHAAPTGAPRSPELLDGCVKPSYIHALFSHARWRAC